MKDDIDLLQRSFWEEFRKPKEPQPNMQYCRTCDFRDEHYSTTWGTYDKCNLIDEPVDFFDKCHERRVKEVLEYRELLRRQEETNALLEQENKKLKLLIW